MTKAIQIFIIGDMKHKTFTQNKERNHMEEIKTVALDILEDRVRCEESLASCTCGYSVYCDACFDTFTHWYESLKRNARKLQSAYKCRKEN